GCDAARGARSFVPHEVPPREDGDEGEPRFADGVRPTLVAIDHGDDAGDVDALAPEALDRAERRAAGGDGVLEDDDLGPRGEALGALDEAAGAVTLLGLPHVEGIQRAPFEGRSEAHGARERAAAELHARDGVDLLAEP